MKLRTLLLTTLLGATALAQQSPKPETAPASKGANKTDPAKDPNINPDGSVTLHASSLGNVVEEIERRIHHWTPKPEGGEWVMPNILLGDDTVNAPIPGNLTLREVSPLQALTLAAAAAGCALEPIMATAESGLESQPNTIIGYRVVPEKKQAQSLDALYGSKTPAKPVDATREPRDANKAVESNMRYRALSNPNSMQNFAPSNDSNFYQGATTDQPDRPFVRVYALGSILNGSKEEVETKEKYFQDLVSTAMEKSAPESGATGVIGFGAGGGGSVSAGKVAFPELSFHLELRALIVKGTAAQHEIIGQVMKALKENETQPAAATSVSK